MFVRLRFMRGRLTATQSIVQNRWNLTPSRICQVWSAPVVVGVRWQTTSSTSGTNSSRVSSSRHNFLFFDLETTGFSHRHDRIIEIAVFDPRSETSFSTLVNPGRPIPYRVSQLTRITNSMVRSPKVPHFRHVILPLCEFISGVTEDAADRDGGDVTEGGPPPLCVLVGHNSRRFDTPFLSAEFARVGYAFPSNWVFLDSLSVVRAHGPSQLTSLGLEALTHSLELDSHPHVQYVTQQLQEKGGLGGSESESIVPAVPMAHRALADACRTAALVERLLVARNLSVNRGLIPLCFTYGVSASTLKSLSSSESSKSLAPVSSSAGDRKIYGGVQGLYVPDDPDSVDPMVERMEQIDTSALYSLDPEPEIYLSPMEPTTTSANSSKSAQAKKNGSTKSRKEEVCVAENDEQPKQGQGRRKRTKKVTHDATTDTQAVDTVKDVDGVHKHKSSSLLPEPMDDGNNSGIESSVSVSVSRQENGDGDTTHPDLSLSFASLSPGAQPRPVAQVLLDGMGRGVSPVSSLSSSSGASLSSTGYAAPTERTQISDYQDKDLSNMFRDYASHKRRHAQHVLLFQVGSFYETFLSDAFILSSVLNVTLTSKQAGKNIGRIPMAGIPVHSAEMHIKKLLKASYSVAVCEQVEAAPASSSSPSSSGASAESGGGKQKAKPKAKGEALLRREVTRILTAGTVMEETLLSTQHNYIAAVFSVDASVNGSDDGSCDGERIYGMAHADVSLGVYKVTSFSSADGVREELLRLRPAEILVPSSLARTVRALVSASSTSAPPPSSSTTPSGDDDSARNQNDDDDDAEREGARAGLVEFNVISRDASVFDEKRCVQQLSALHSHNNHSPDTASAFSLFSSSSPSAPSSVEAIQFDPALFASVELQAAGALLDYVQDTHRSSMAHVPLLPLSRYTVSSYMVLDDVARRHLELVRSQRENTTKGSLFYAINRCSTAAGTRILKDWLLQPLIDEHTIVGRQGTVASLLENHDIRMQVRHMLKHVPDVSRIVARIHQANLRASSDTSNADEDETKLPASKGDKKKDLEDEVIDDDISGGNNFVSVSPMQLTMRLRDMRALAEGLRVFPGVANALGQAQERECGGARDNAVLSRLITGLSHDALIRVYQRICACLEMPSSSDQARSSESNEEEDDEDAKEEDDHAGGLRVGNRSGRIIRLGVDPKLDELVEKAIACRQWLKDYEAEQREVTGIKHLRIMHTKGSYYIRVSRTAAKQNADMIPEDYKVAASSARSEVRYVTRALQQTQYKLFSLHERIDRLQTIIFEKLRAYVAAHTTILMHGAECIAETDVFAGLACLALEEGYVRPIIRPAYTRELYIRDGRHPVVEQHIDIAGGQEFVPNSIAIGGPATILPDEDVEVEVNDADVDVDINDDGVSPTSPPDLILLTGPNAAGKSCYIRQVGLIQIMAQIGSFVPASRAVLSICDRVYTRVGAVDDLAGGRSTFVVEMCELASILRGCTPHSLLLLDEIGRGTSPTDGVAIACAVIEHLTEGDVVEPSKPSSKIAKPVSKLASPNIAVPRSLFATHFHELIPLLQQNTSLSTTSSSKSTRSPKSKKSKKAKTKAEKLRGKIGFFQMAVQVLGDKDADIVLDGNESDENGDKNAEDDEPQSAAESLHRRQRIQFLHKVVRGAAAHSFGIEVAALAGLPTGVIARAADIHRQVDARLETTK